MVIVVLTWTNSRGLNYGMVVQNVFTSAKLLALFALIVLGFTLGWNPASVHANFTDFWSPRDFNPITAGISAASTFGLVVAICVSQSGSLFSADSWHNITFTGGEVRDPRRTLALALGIGSALVILLYLLANAAYLVVLPFSAIKTLPPTGLPPP